MNTESSVEKEEFPKQKKRKQEDDAAGRIGICVEPELIWENLEPLAVPPEAPVGAPGIAPAAPANPVDVPPASAAGAVESVATPELSELYPLSGADDPIKVEDSVAPDVAPSIVPPSVQMRASKLFDKFMGKVTDVGATVAKVSTDLGTSVASTAKTTFERITEKKPTGSKSKLKTFNSQSAEFQETGNCPICGVKYSFLSRILFENGKNKTERELRIKKHLTDHFVIHVMEKKR